MMPAAAEIRAKRGKITQSLGAVGQAPQRALSTREQSGRQHVVGPGAASPECDRITSNAPIAASAPRRSASNR